MEKEQVRETVANIEFQHTSSNSDSVSGVINTPSLHAYCYSGPHDLNPWDLWDGLREELVRRTNNNYV